MSCSPQEMPRCWHVGGLGKLSSFCPPERKFYQSSLWRILLFPFTKIVDSAVIARAKRKGHHWYAATTFRQPAGMVGLFSKYTKNVNIRVDAANEHAKDIVEPYNWHLRKK